MPPRRLWSDLCAIVLVNKGLGGLPAIVVANAAAHDDQRTFEVPPPCDPLARPVGAFQLGRKPKVIMRKMAGSFREYVGQSGAVLMATGHAIGQVLIDATVDTIVGALRAGKPLLVCGNGGSASDAMHFTTELLGRYLIERGPLRVFCLCDNAAFLTAWTNDCGYEAVFARQVEAYGEPGAALLGISTSGRSKNVIAAFQKARQMGIKTIALTGEGGGALGPLADCLLAVPSRSTPLIQQIHICVYHYLCQQIEERMGR